jgi:hypothetical protein
MTKDKPGSNLDEIEFAESKLAESRDRLKRLKNLQEPFLAGSAQRVQATIIDEIETLHQVIERLCRRLRGRLH